MADPQPTSASPEASRERTREIRAFLVWTFALSWSLALGFRLAGGEWQGTASYVVAIVYMYMPALAAVIVARFHARKPIGSDLGVRLRPNRWFAVAAVLPLLLAVATLGAGLLVPGVRFDPLMTDLIERLAALAPGVSPEAIREQMDVLPVHPYWLAIPQALIAGATINALVAFGEELGWRGFLYTRTIHLGFWKSSALIGLIWGVWHAPIILQGHNYPDHPVAGVFLMTLWTLLLAPLFQWIRLRSQSVVAAAILHGALNASAGLAVMVLSGGNDLTIGLTGAAGMAVLLVANLVLALAPARQKEPAP